MQDFTHQPLKRDQEAFRGLNVLRALSAIGIVLMHILANISPKPSNNYLTSSIIPFFTHFVLLFFIISAFSMCCGYYTPMKNGLISMNKFYTKRYWRILPFFALLCMIDILLSPSYNAFLQGFMNCTLVFNLLPNPDISVIGVGWFLGIVFVFYMLFPFFVFLIDNRKRAWGVLFITFIIHHLCTNYFFLTPFITFNPGRHQILYSAPYFIVGGLIYLYRSDLKNIIISLNRWALPLVVFITIIRFIYVPYAWKESLFYIDILLFSTWTIYAIGSSSRWFHNRIIDYFSEISMEIYLSHMVIFRAVEYLHLADHISNSNILYIITSILVLIGATAFSHITKYYLLNRLIKP